MNRIRWWLPGVMCDDHFFTPIARVVGMVVYQQYVISWPASMRIGGDCRRKPSAGGLPASGASSPLEAPPPSHAARARAVTIEAVDRVARMEPPGSAGSLATSIDPRSMTNRALSLVRPGPGNVRQAP